MITVVDDDVIFNKITKFKFEISSINDLAKAFIKWWAFSIYKKKIYGQSLLIWLDDRYKKYTLFVSYYRSI